MLAVKSLPTAIFLFVLSIPIHFLHPAWGDPLILQNGASGYSGTDDASIYSENVDFSNGANTEFATGRIGNTAPNPPEGNLRRSAIRFDLSSISPNETILAATLELRLVAVPGLGPINADVALHPILADWNEGTLDGGQNGAPAESGDITWSSSQFGTASWTLPGGDFGPASATATVSRTPGVFRWSGPQLTQDVIDWILEPEDNFGWMVVGDESGTLRTARRFAASETGLVANRPRLLIAIEEIPASVEHWELYGSEPESP